MGSEGRMNRRRRKSCFLHQHNDKRNCILVGIIVTHTQPQNALRERCNATTTTTTMMMLKQINEKKEKDYKALTNELHSDFGWKEENKTWINTNGTEQYQIKYMVYCKMKLSCLRSNSYTFPCFSFYAQFARNFSTRILIKISLS